MGAVAAGVPAMHVLTGVHQARDVIRAPRGQRPSYLAIDMRGLLEATLPEAPSRWNLDVRRLQVAKATRSGALTLDDVELTEPVTVSIDSYRALELLPRGSTQMVPVRRSLAPTCLGRR